MNEIFYYKYNADEELMCENINTIKQQEEIPPFPDIKRHKNQLSFFQFSKKSVVS
ncbi:hypothetical protein [Methanosphaera cuniculi]|uniref:hypothetical protein n=1 Tax=Methanosphaera cuniculi TaxID=1077256 RepID=UPI0026DB2EEB|nr:hypothetical protein [Methanosphaera cuniculi]